MADRYLYIPLLGPLVLLAWAVRALARRWPVLAPGAPALAGIAVVVAAGLTVMRIPAFHDELSLWADWALRTPYISADRPYGPQPRPRELELLRAALARDGDSAALHNNVGAIAFEENRMADAIAELARAHALDPRDPTIALNLGRAYLHARQPEAAARALEDAVRLEPPSFWAHLNLGRAYLMLGDAKRARPALERVRDMRPTWRDWQTDFLTLERLERGAG
jgi:predicted Zn-dependent protease